MSHKIRDRRNVYQQRFRKKPSLLNLNAIQKLELMEKVKRDYLNGLSAHDIASKYSISTASVYKWHRDHSKIFFEAVNRKGKLINIDNIIDILCTLKSRSIFEKADAVFQFNTWIRWPKDRSYHRSGMARCVLSYVIQTTDHRSLLDLDVSALTLLSRYIDLHDLSMYLSTHAPFLPDYDIQTNATNRKEDLDFYAKISAYLISDPITVSNKLIAPTLKKAAYLAQEGVFGKNFIMSERTFQTRWIERGSSFPFIFAERYHCSFDWNLNPSDRYFAEEVNDLLSRPDIILEYFRAALAVTKRFEERLDRRAWDAAKMPVFPKWLEPLHLAIQPVSDLIKSKIEVY